MKILITGGSGFLGRRLLGHLLKVGSVEIAGQFVSIDTIAVFDTCAMEKAPQDARVEVLTGDLNDSAEVAEAARGADLVWHLAAVVSSAAEADFDLGMNVNIHGLLCLLEELRRQRRRPRLVNTSGFAVFGGELPDTVIDQTAPTPQSSYGMQKAVAELLVTDYSRRGFIDGRTVRLPTIAIRPGKPNRAASSFVSSILREPIAGQEAVCPVKRETAVYISSPRSALRSLMLAMQLSDDMVGGSRTIPLPGITVTIGEMIEALGRIAGDEAVRRIRWEPDAETQRIVESWPAHVEARRATLLGFPQDRSIEEIIRAHIEDQGAEQ
jgi:nucleoside-diphosphate-sugar epimerase